MNFFIIGGAGFIGYNLSKYLISKGNIVFINDIRLKKEDNISIEDGIKKCDYIIHLAGSVGVDNIIKNPFDSTINNINLEKEIFTINNKFKKPLLFASTSEVYGNNGRIPLKEDRDLNIGIPTQGRWSYSCSKLLGEFLALQSSFPSIIVRFFNITGSGQTDQWVLPRFVKLSLKGETIKIFSKNSIRCFCHVNDSIEAIEKLITNESCYNDIFNIGNPSNIIGIDELAKLIIKKTNKGCIEYYNQRVNNEIYYRVPDISKIENITGWKPKKTLDEIIDDVIEYERYLL